MIASVLGGLVLVAVLTAFLFLGRSGANIQNYNDMEAQARRALEMFAEDTRQASAVTWTSADSVTLVVDTNTVTYAFSGGQLTRAVGGGTAKPIVTGITSFSFLAYTITGAQITDFSTAAALVTAAKDTKQIQISLATSRTSATVATATNTVLSARFILRNKLITT
ncbi:hypothetical protein Oter_0649 [Opitutus terrae PB90-1]|uniref:Uncharacterized protein n=2 Tax=Opitutus terrae TaxID=107709 RepID=B1ZTJ4_OPITP|nr:hypothetical protein Oter_0649 [Opitutus terrae PB90-1]